MSKPRILTPEQKAAKVAAQRARRHAKTPPRMPMTPEEYRLKRLAAMSRRRAEFQAQFVGPRWPIGRRRDPQAAWVVPVRPALVGPPKPPKPSPVAREPKPVRIDFAHAKRRAAKAEALEADRRRREAVAFARAGRAWDRAAVDVLKQAVRGVRQLDRQAKKRAYAAEQERRRRLTPEAKEAEYRESLARAEAIRLAALGSLASQERQRLAEVRAAEEVARAARDADAAQRRTSALAAAQAVAASLTASRSVGRVAFVPPSLS